MSLFQVSNMILSTFELKIHIYSYESHFFVHKQFFIMRRLFSMSAPIVSCNMFNFGSQPKVSIKSFFPSQFLKLLVCRPPIMTSHLPYYVHHISITDLSCKFTHARSSFPKMLAINFLVLYVAGNFDFYFYWLSYTSS